MGDLALFVLYLGGRPGKKKMVDGSFEEVKREAKAWAQQYRQFVEIWEVQPYESVWVKTVYYDEKT